MNLNTKTLQEQKQEIVYKTKQVSKTRTFLLLVSLTSLGIVGRVAFQTIPSVEPILPLAVALSFFHDWKKGMVSGTSAFFLSNFFVWGFQGPWTFFQCLGIGIASIFAGYLSKISKRKSLFFFSLIIGTVFYEVAVNFGSFLFFPWALTLGLPYLLASIPFGAIHLTSSLGFGSIAYAFKDKIQDIWEEDEVLSVWYSNNSPPGGSGLGKITRSISNRKDERFFNYRLRNEKVSEDSHSR